MSDAIRALLPPGIRVATGIGLDDAPVGRIDLAREAFTGEKPPRDVAIVLTPRQLRALAAVCLKTADTLDGRAVFVPRLVGGAG